MATKQLVWYRWRFWSNNVWSKWIALEPAELEAFKRIQEVGLNNGTVELQPLYGE